MEDHELRAVAEAFLASYGAAFDAYDADGVAAHYALPCTVLSDAEPVSRLMFETAADARDAVARVLAWHRDLGVVGGAVKGMTARALSPRLLVLDLDYELQRAGRVALYDFQGVYTLALYAGRWRIATLVHNQIPRLLARLKAEPPA